MSKMSVYDSVPWTTASQLTLETTVPSKQKPNAFLLKSGKPMREWMGKHFVMCKITRYWFVTMLAPLCMEIVIHRKDF